MKKKAAKLQNDVATRDIKANQCAFFVDSISSQKLLAGDVIYFFCRGNLLLHDRVQTRRDHKNPSLKSPLCSAEDTGALGGFPLPIKFMILRPAAGDAPQIQTASRREERLPLVVCAPRVAVSAAAGGVCAQRSAMHGFRALEK